MQPVFIIASARSGSYLLLSYLDSHSEISSLGEVINPDLVRGIRTKFVSKSEVIFHIKTSINAAKSKIGVAKLLMDQMQAHDLTLKDLVSDFPDAKFVVLYRRSLAKQFISHEIAKSTGMWTLSDRNKEKWKEQKLSIKVNPDELIDFCNQTKDFYTGLKDNNSNGNKVMFVSYEELIGDSKENIGRQLFTFLQLPITEIETSYKKMNKSSDEEVVTNYHEVKELFQSDLCKLKL